MGPLAVAMRGEYSHRVMTVRNAGCYHMVHATNPEHDTRENSDS